jgi:uncharacterized protein (DUF58 family)
MSETGPAAPGQETAATRSTLAEKLLAVPVTARGVGLAAAAAALIASGWLWGYPELAALGAAAALACVAAGSVIAAKPRLDVARTVTPDRVSVGHTATVQLTVRNTGRWRAVNARAVDAYGTVQIYGSQASPRGPETRRGLRGARGVNRV